MAAREPANAIATTASELPRATSTTTTAQELDSTDSTEYLSPTPQTNGESSTRSGRTTSRSRHGCSNSFGGLSSLWGTSTAASSLTSQNAHLNAEFAQLPTHRDRAAALRQLNGTSTPSPFSRSTSKASSSRTTLSSQPVIVRTYSGTRPRSSSSIRPSSVAARGRMKTEPPPRLPKVEEFSFDGILRAVEPDIQGTIDAIAEICARSKMSLADEHASHIPPQGEITNPDSYSNGPSLQPYRAFGGQGWRLPGYDHAPLTTVPEASSSSGGSRGSSDSGKRRRTSAYGSLKNLVTGKQREDKISTVPLETSGELNWAALVQQHPPVAIMTSPTASRQLSLDITNLDDGALAEPTAKSTGEEQVAARPSQARSSSLTSWLPLPWPSASASASATATKDDGSTAETLLKDLLRSTSYGGTKTVSSYG